jgi:hypothetical protein
MSREMHPILGPIAIGIWILIFAIVALGMSLMFYMGK